MKVVEPLSAGTAARAGSPASVAGTVTESQ